MSLAPNGAILRNSNRAACHYDGADYICYQDAQYIKVIKVVDGAIVQGPVTVHTYNAITTGRTTGIQYGDMHGTPSITVVQSGTDAGRILIATALHVTHLDVYRSNAIEDISAFTRARVETSQPDGIDGATYPRLLALANGNIYCSYRCCYSSTQHYQVHKISADGGATWGSRVLVIKPKNGATNDVAYAAPEMKPGTNEIHIPWTTSDYARWFDSHHIYSTDGGATWKKTDGSVVTLPATNTNVPAFHTTAPTSTDNYVFDVAFDEQGHPRIVGVETDNSAGHWYVWEWNGTSWSEHLIANCGRVVSAHNGSFHPVDPDLVIFPRHPASATHWSNVDGQPIALAYRDNGVWTDLGDLTVPPGVTFDGFPQFVDKGKGDYVFARFSKVNLDFTFLATIEGGFVAPRVGSVDFDLTLPSPVVLAAIDFDLTLPSTFSTGALDFDLTLPGRSDGLTAPRDITAPMTAMARGVSDIAAIVGGERWSATAEPFWP